MNIWIDEHIPAPEDYIWCKSIYDAINQIAENLKHFRETLESLEDKNNAPEELFEDLKISVPSFGRHVIGQYSKLCTWLKEKGFEVCSLFDVETFRQILLAK